MNPVILHGVVPPEAGRDRDLISIVRNGEYVVREQRVPAFRAEGLGTCLRMI